MSKNALRLLVGFYVLSYVAGLILLLFNPQDLRSGEGLPTSLGFFLSVSAGLAVLHLVAVIGLFVFASWGKAAFVAYHIINFAYMLAYSTGTVGGIHEVLFALHYSLAGMIICAAFLVRFENDWAATSQ